jgi:putative transcriptional regulator
VFDDSTKSRVARWVAGDIILSDEPGRVLRRWREMFGMSQTALAKALHISPSVISDYEAGRRKSPGAATVRRIVEAFIRVDEQQGGKVMHAFTHMFGAPLSPDVVLEIREFGEPVDGKMLCKTVGGEVVANKDLLDRKLFGYTVVDSHRAILTLSAGEFERLYGLTTERALIFTGVTAGRSPMVAIKVKGIAPGMIIFHGKLKQVDPLGIKIAEILRVPLVVSRLPTVNELMEKLRKCAT